MRALLATLLMMLLFGVPTPIAAQATTQPIVIVGSILLEVVYRRSGYEQTSQLRLDFHVTITGDKVEGAGSRNEIARDGRVLRSEPRNFSGSLGQVRELKTDPGHAVATLSGNTLTLLQTAKTGATRTTIAIGRGSGCGIRFEMMKEVGKGNMQRKSVAGLDTEVVSYRKLSSTCRVSRG